MKLKGLLPIVDNFEDFPEMNLILTIFRNAEALNLHERSVLGIAISEMNNIKSFSFKPRFPIRLDFPVLDFLDAGCDSAKPLPMECKV